MRARMALRVSGIEYEHREVLLRDKPQEMLALSPKATVPVLVLKDGTIIDESFDIMVWALTQNDPDGWLSPGLETMLPHIETITGDFIWTSVTEIIPDRPAFSYGSPATIIIATKNTGKY